MVGLLLLLVANFFKFILWYPLYLYGLYKSIKTKNFDTYHRNLAISKDKYGNVLGQYLFNDVLIKKNGYRFGNCKETISSVLGKNRRRGALTIWGVILDKALDIIDPNHSIKNIDNNV